MFIGHLPAAYLLAQAVKRKARSVSASNQPIVLTTLIGGIAPDIDLIYFYTIGGKRVVHHEYWTHIPVYWLAIFMVCTSVAYLVGCTRYVFLLSVALCGVLLHLMLDTVTGKIQWLYPYSNQAYTFVEVPSVHHWWVFNFLFHWTFLAEILLLVLAIAVYVDQRNVQHTNTKM